MFGFTEEEVFQALEDRGLSDQNGKVRFWYDGFTFGNRTDIYNPWSITNYLKKEEFRAYWANSSSNRLISDWIQTGELDIQNTLYDLLEGKSLTTEISEEIVFSDLDQGAKLLWSLLLTSGYLKVISVKDQLEEGSTDPEYTLVLTNGEVRMTFAQMAYRKQSRKACKYFAVF